MLKKIKVSELVDFIKVCDLWECKSCGGGPCYYTGEYPHCCACDGKDFIDKNEYNKGILISKMIKIKWRKLKLVTK